MHIVRDCSHPGFPDSTPGLKRLVFEEHSIRYSCDTDYNLVGNNERSCSNSDSGILPYCQPEALTDTNTSESGSGSGDGFEAGKYDYS